MLRCTASYSEQKKVLNKKMVEHVSHAKQKKDLNVKNALLVVIKSEQREKKVIRNNVIKVSM